MQALHTEDGVPLHLRCWSLRGAARGTVLIVHGLGEHIGRYEALAGDVNTMGWHVAGYDQRGHGASGGARGRIPRSDSLLRDLARVIDCVRALRCGPLVLLGHSLGGLVSARFVAERLVPARSPWSRPVEALVLASPALDPGLHALKRALVGALGVLAPDLVLGNGLRVDRISRDPAVVRAYGNDPLVHHRIGARLARFIVDGGVAVRQHAAAWNVPTLLMWAGADRCVSPAGSAAFAAAAPREVLHAREFPALFHELFHEPERADVLAVLAQWLDDHQRPRTT